MKYLSIIILLTVFIFAGCSSSSETTGNEEQNGSQEIYVFDDVAAEDTMNIVETDSVEVDVNNSTDTTKHFIVQVGAFKTKAAAEKFVESNIKKINYEMQITYSEIVNLYVVQLPAFENRLEAESIRNKLWTTKNFHDAFILTK